MSLNYLDKCIAQLLSIYTSHLSNGRQVVLCGVSVELPVNIHATLVLRNRIILQFVVGLGLFLSAGTSQ